MKWKFRWNWREDFADQSSRLVAPIASLHLSIRHWSLSRNMTYEQNRMFRIESCAKQQVWIDDLSEERASAQVRIEQPSDFRWRAQMLGNDVRRDSESIATKVCCQIGHKWNEMFEGRVVTSVAPAMTGLPSIFDLKIFWAICLCKHSTTVLLTNHPWLDFEDLS